MEALIAQLQRNEMGVPAIPLVATYEAAWCDGPTLRAHNAVEGAVAKSRPARKK